MSKAAILIDGGCLLKRLPAVRADIDSTDPQDVGRAINQLVWGHLNQLNDVHQAQSGPEVAEAERDRVEGGDAHRLVVLCAPDKCPLAVAELERLEGAVRRVDEPKVRDPFAGVDRAPRAPRTPSQAGGSRRGCRDSPAFARGANPRGRGP